MAEYRNPDGTTTYVEKRSSTGKVIGLILLAILIVVGILFATGFWSADVKGGSLPKVNVSAKGGDMPDVDVHSKEVVVGTSKQTVTVPKVETKKTTVDVPTVGVKDSN
jgi:preprotein translocase subunit SecF